MLTPGSRPIVAGSARPVATSTNCIASPAISRPPAPTAYPRLPGTPCTTSSARPTTWPATSHTWKPAQRVGASHSDAESDSISAANDSYSSSAPRATSVRSRTEVMADPLVSTSGGVVLIVTGAARPVDSLGGNGPTARWAVRGDPWTTVCPQSGSSCGRGGGGGGSGRPHPPPPPG